MISKTDKGVIIKCAKKYNVSPVILFVSILIEGEKANDFGIGAKEIPPGLFFRSYAELFKHLIRTFLHNICNVIKNILKQIACLKSYAMPRLESRHEELLNLLVSQRIILENS